MSLTQMETINKKEETSPLKVPRSFIMVKKAEKIEDNGGSAKGEDDENENPLKVERIKSPLFSQIKAKAIEFMNKFNVYCVPAHGIQAHPFGRFGGDKEDFISEAWSDVVAYRTGEEEVNHFAIDLGPSGLCCLSASKGKAKEIIKILESSGVSTIVLSVDHFYFFMFKRFKHGPFKESFENEDFTFVNYGVVSGPGIITTKRGETKITLHGTRFADIPDKLFSYFGAPAPNRAAILTESLYGSENPGFMIIQHQSSINEQIASEFLLSAMNVRGRPPRIVRDISDKCLYFFSTNEGMYISDPVGIRAIIKKAEFNIRLNISSEKISDYNYFGNSTNVEKVRVWLQESEGDDIPRVHINPRKSFGYVLFQDGIYCGFDNPSRKETAGDFIQKFDPSLCFTTSTGLRYPEEVDADKVEYLRLNLFEKPFHSAEVGSYLLKELKRMLLGNNRKKNLFFLIGKRDSGKGVLTAALSKTFGQYIGTFCTDNIFLQKNGGEPARQYSWLIPLKDKRLCISNEIDDTKDKKPSFKLLKSLSGGGDTFTARALYQSEINFEFFGNMMIMANDMIDLKDADDAMISRLRIIEYIKSFVENPDPNDQDQLQADDEIKDRVQQPEYCAALFYLIMNQDISNIVPPKECTRIKEECAADSRASEIYDYFEKKLIISGDKEDLINCKALSASIKSFLNKDIDSAKIGRELRAYCRKLKLPEVETKKNCGDRSYIGIRFK